MSTISKIYLSFLIGGSVLFLAAPAVAYTNLPSAYAALGFDPTIPGNSVVVHLSDPHMVLGSGVTTTNLDPRLVGMINGMVPSPAKVIVSGDICTTYGLVPGFEPQGDWNITYGSNEMCLWFSAIRAITNTAQTNIVWVPGNHDQVWTETNADMFARIFTNMPVHQRFDLGGVRFLLMNGGNYADPPEAERRWVEQQLAATSPTQTVAVVEHWPAFPRGVGLPVVLREWFRNWRAPWWILCGHEHSKDIQVYNVGASNVAQLVAGAASTNTFGGDTDSPGCRILCLSNGIAGTIYYHMRGGSFELEDPPEWDCPTSYVAAFEQVPGLLWRRLMTLKRPGPEVIVTNAQNSVEWFAYPEELRWALPLANHGNQATHFLLLSSFLDSQVTVDFSADGANWIPVPLPPNTNWVYSLPLPPEVALAPTGYARLQGPNTINNFIYGWGLSTTNALPLVTYPQLARTPNQAVALGQILVVTNVAIDPYSPPDELRFSLLNSPATASLDPKTGVFSWQPTNESDLGDWPVTIKVADTGTPEMSATRTFRVTVVPSNSPPVVPDNSPPVLAIPDQHLALGMTLTLVVPASDPDYDTLTFQLDEDAPANVRLDPISGLLQWTPDDYQVGEHTFAVIATDDAAPSLSTTQYLSVTVLPLNHLPELAAVPSQVLVTGTTLEIANSASDPDDDQMTFSLAGEAVPANAELDPFSGALRWTPNASQVGIHRFDVVVTDSGLPTLAATQEISVVVLHSPPCLSSPWSAGGKRYLAVSGDAGLAYTVEVSTNLSDWEVLCTTNTVTTVFQVEDAAAADLSPRFYRAGVSQPSWDPDAEAFFRRAGLTDHLLFAVEKNAVNQLVQDYKAAGLWETKDVIYPFVGTTSNSCAQNLKSPNCAIRFTVTGMTYGNGIRGDGSGWGDTGLNLRTASRYQQDSGSFFAYIDTQDPTFPEGLGCFLGGAEFGAITSRACLERNGSAFSVGGLNAPDLWNWLGVLNDFHGPVFVSRVSATLQYNGTARSVVTNNCVFSTAAPNVTCGLLARKCDARNADHQTACGLRGVSIGAGMEPMDFAVEASIWQRFNSTLAKYSTLVEAKGGSSLP